MSHLPYSVFTILLSLLFSGCQRQPTPKLVVDEPAFQKPTATEIFNLRTKCAELGNKINGEHDFVQSASLTFTLPVLKQEQSSHYDPRTNRCYVELRVSVNTDALAFMMVASKDNVIGRARLAKMKEGVDAFLDHYELHYIECHLYDGQTGEELVSLQSGSKDVKPTGEIKSSETTVQWPDALEEINKLMADDRKQ